MDGVRAYHVRFCAYGFWLPNDPRGSWSHFVRSWEVFRAGGPATKVETRRSVAGRAHDVEARLRTKEALRYAPVVFDGYQALSIAHGFERMITKARYLVFACSILPNHVHMVIGRYHYSVETMVRLLKAAATTALLRDGRHSFSPSPWARKCWKVFLNTEADIVRAIRYVEDNPLKESKRPQRWSFVVPFTPTMDV
jgi:REP element-mobilizing transposase RayT